MENKLDQLENKMAEIIFAAEKAKADQEAGAINARVLTVEQIKEKIRASYTQASKEELEMGIMERKMTVDSVQNIIEYMQEIIKQKELEVIE
jgi:hypothetical protein